MINFGLSANAITKLKSLFKGVDEIENIKIFGSRAMGTFREGSDIDIAIFGKRVNPNIIRDLSIRYYNLNLPYQIDFVHYESITNLELKKHIDTFAVDFKS